MLKISEKFLFYSLIAISSISFINIAALYWFPIQFPLSSYTATGLMATAFFTKNYWLIPISISFCALMFITAFSFPRRQTILPIILSVYLLFDLIILAFSFFNSWLYDEHFIAGQLIQIIISIAIIVFTGIYLVLNWRQENNT